MSDSFQMPQKPETMLNNRIFKDFLFKFKIENRLHAYSPQTNGPLESDGR
jgi:hypothetical protein